MNACLYPNISGSGSAAELPYCFARCLWRAPAQASAVQDNQRLKDELAESRPQQKETFCDLQGFRNLLRSRFDFFRRIAIVP